MTIAKTLDDDLKQAMRARDADKVACIRQLRSKVQEAVNSPGFSGDVDDDALYQTVIAAYTKQLKNGIDQLASGGSRGAALVAKYTQEIDYLSTFLPQLLDAEATRVHVREALAELGIDDSKQAGRVLGHLMKSWRGQIDPSLARRLILEELTPA